MKSLKILFVVSSFSLLYICFFGLFAQDLAKHFFGRSNLLQHLS